MAADLEVPVLIVGGGPVGLTTALLLGHYGVRPLLVERHPGTSQHPKARLVNGRTMEVFRHCGIEQIVREAALPPDMGRWLIWARTLTGKELERRPGTFADAGAGWGPAPPCSCAQEILEPTLLDELRRRDAADVMFGTELTDFQQDGSGVDATIEERSSGRRLQVRASYMVAADGAKSPSRERLEIALAGEAGLEHPVSILFQADLSPWYADRPFFLCFIDHPGVPGVFANVNGRDRWVFQAHDYSGQPADLTPERCAEIVQTALGLPDLPLQILLIAPWVASALVADRFRAGHVFLAGDAAHETTPMGGFGMNVGIQDAHNLAWKLAAVLHGWAGAALLDTYEAERLPVSRAFVERSLHNTKAARTRWLRTRDGAAATQTTRTTHTEDGLIFGATYGSAAVVSDGTPAPEVDDPVTQYAPNARPGSRAPHFWLEEGVSTLDLFGKRLTLLTGAAGDTWLRAARCISRVPLQAHAISDEHWASAYGVSESGAVLVRPDGYVAWRSRSGSSQPKQDLEHAIRAILALETS